MHFCTEVVLDITMICVSIFCKIRDCMNCEVMMKYVDLC